MLLPLPRPRYPPCQPLSPNLLCHPCHLRTRSPARHPFPNLRYRSRRCPVAQLCRQVPLLRQRSLRVVSGGQHRPQKRLRRFRRFRQCLQPRLLDRLHLSRFSVTARAVPAHPMSATSYPANLLHRPRRLVSSEDCSRGMSHLPGRVDLVNHRQSSPHRSTMGCSDRRARRSSLHPSWLRLNLALRLRRSLVLLQAL